MENIALKMVLTTSEMRREVEVDCRLASEAGIKADIGRGEVALINKQVVGWSINQEPEPDVGRRLFDFAVDAQRERGSRGQRPRARPGPGPQHALHRPRPRK